MDKQAIENAKSYRKKERIYTGIGVALVALTLGVFAICRLAGLEDGMPAMTAVYFVVAALVLAAICIVWLGNSYNSKCREIMWLVAAQYVAEQLKDTNFLSGSTAHIKFCYKADELTDEQFENLSEEELKKLDEEESVAVLECPESGARLEIDMRPIWDLPALINKKGAFMVDDIIIREYFEAACYRAAQGGKMPLEVTFDDGFSSKPAYIVANGQQAIKKPERNTFIKYGIS